jgi:hypothetical protein
MLPDARPTPSQMYGPRGVFMNDDLLIVADTGNHRVLIWHSLPESDGQPADVVLGQPDFFTEGPKAGGRGPENGFYLPTGVGVWDGQLYLADAWHHRILVWQEVPRTSDQPADYVLGQADFSQVEPNRGGSVGPDGFYWPFGMAYIEGHFYVTDTGNRRVLGWQGLPTPGQLPDLVLGQDTPYQALENRGGSVGPVTFRWPHALAGTSEVLYVADAGNHRVLGWMTAPESDRAADLVLGQPDFTSAREWPYGPQSASGLRFPYGITQENGRLAVADTANNRVLIWNTLPLNGNFEAADAVIGQPDFKSNGENHWKEIGSTSLCWPYGIHLHNNRLAIADSGNNRVMIWHLG